MDYAYSPIKPININQRIIGPIKLEKILKGMRLIKSDLNDKKIIRKKQKIY